MLGCRASDNRGGQQGKQAGALSQPGASPSAEGEEAAVGDIRIPPSPPEAANAKVIIKAFYPLNEGHKEIIEVLKDLEKRHLGKVRVEAYEIRKPDEKPEDFAAWRKTGLSCAGIFINGQDTVKVKDAQGEREVTFHRAMGGEWTKAELIAAVEQEVKRQYGK